MQQYEMLKFPHYVDESTIAFYLVEDRHTDEKGLLCSNWLITGTQAELETYIHVKYTEYKTLLSAKIKSNQMFDIPIIGIGSNTYIPVDSNMTLATSVRGNISNVCGEDGVIYNYGDMIGSSLPDTDGAESATSINRTKFTEYQNRVIKLTYSKTKMGVGRDESSWFKGMDTGKTTRLAGPESKMDCDRFLRDAARRHGLVYHGSKRNAGFIINPVTYDSAGVTSTDQWFTLNPKRKISHEECAEALNLFNSPSFKNCVILSIPAKNCVYNAKVGVSSCFYYWWWIGNSVEVPHTLKAAALHVWNARKDRLVKIMGKKGYGSNGEFTVDIAPSWYDLCRKLFEGSEDDPDVKRALRVTKFAKRDVIIMDHNRRYVYCVHPEHNDLINIPKGLAYLMDHGMETDDYIKMMSRTVKFSSFKQDWERIKEAEKWFLMMDQKHGTR